MDKPKPRGRRPRTQLAVGQRFERLVVTSLDVPRLNVGSPSHPKGEIAAACRCDCGTEVTVLQTCLRSGRARSCGCLKRDKNKQQGAARSAAASAARAVRAARRQKACFGCGVVLALAEFTVSSGRPDGRADYCRACQSEDSKRRYDREKNTARCARSRHAHPEEYAEQGRRWALANPEKVLAKMARYRESVRSQVFDHYGRACACCGGTEDLSIDHVYGDGAQHRLEALGDTHAGGIWFYGWLVRNGFPGGFQTLCRRCNSSKQRGERCRLRHAAA